MKFSFIDETNQSFINNTNQKGEIYFAIIGNNPSGQTCHLDKNGTLIPCDVSDNDAEGHLTKNGQNWCNYFYTIKEVDEIEVPHIISGRAYISLGSPMYLKISHANTFIQPDTANPSDPNVDVYFDWLEFTIDDRGFHGNTTQVDQFGFPMVIELIATDGHPQEAGILKDRKRSDLFNKYTETVPAEFQSLVQKPHDEKKAPFRIIAPFKGSFANGGNNATYFDDYIGRMWRYYTANQLKLSIQEGTFIGKVENNIFTFTKADSPDTKYTINYPKSWEVFECSGVFATGEAIQKAIQAQISTMFNRHILEHPEKKCEPTEYYKEAPANYYAEFWHLHSINNKAYGFPFDDVCNQSTLLEHTVPQELKVTIRWD
ncbi:MAG: glycoside hydrolase family 64 protein [Nostoc sp.]|uniref:glycoside hydrolase family 64 protein n=1 Tax=Nostoc sp. TaxID=1180 RepID=UPI002FFC91FA